MCRIPGFELKVYYNANNAICIQRTFVCRITLRLYNRYRSFVHRGVIIFRRSYMQYQYPLQISFKVISFGPQLFMRDATARELFFVHQKAFKLKEDVAVYSDSTKSQQVFRIQADRVLDISAEYTFTDSAGSPVGKIKREGMKSLFKASYNVMDTSGQQTHHIKEDNPWVRVADAVMESIPLVGMFAGYLFHPSYTIYRMGTEAPVMRLTKKPAFFEGRFEIITLDEAVAPAEENQLLLSYMMMILLERARG